MLEKDRINELIEAVMKVARGDYSAQIELSDKNDELDSLAMGLNMMIDDIRDEITEREKTEERIEHINSILLAIRNVNQLITRERDRDKLLKGACENLIETRGYYNAWIALLDESGMLVTTAEAGLGEDFLPVVEWLKSGKTTTCSQKALKRKEVISIVDPSSTCVDCPLAGKYIDRGAMSIRLEYGRKIYGLLSVSVPRDFVSDEEEKALFDEISGDIAFALYNIEVDEERKKAEEALKRSEDKYRSLTNNINIGIYRSTPGPKGKFLEVNPALVKIFGYKSREKFLALDVVSLYQNPEDRKKFSEKVKKEGFVRNEELRLKRKDGTPIIASAGTVAIKDDKGKVKYYDGIIEDITERKKVEEALQKKTHDLNERLKELSCLYGIDEICRREGVTINEVLKEAVRLMPPSWQYPEVTGVHISYKKKEYKTENFMVTQWKQRADLIVNNKKCGLVEVCYLEEKPKSDEGPFLKEERHLINSVAERLSQFIGHRQAEVDLKDSEERYRDLVEKAGIAILVDDENGKIIYGNQKSEDLYGYSLKELKNQSIQSLVHPDDIKKVAQFHNDRLQGKEVPSSYEFKGVKKDGSIIYVELDVVELKDKERAIGTRLYLKDITERKKAEELLRTSEAQLSNAMQIARLGNWEYDVVSDLFTFNDYFYAIFRTTADKVGGYTMSPARYTELFLYPDDKAVVAIEMKKAFEAVDPYFSRQLEHRIVYADGNIGWISVRFFIVKDDHGRTVKTYGVNQDITERKKAEEEMRMRGSVIESSINAVAIASLEASLTYVNNSFLKMWGYDDEKEVIGRPATQFWQMEEKAEEVMESLRNKGSWVGEIAAKQKGGPQFDVQLSSTMVKDKNGRPICMTASFLDITDQKKAAEELKDSEERLKIIFEYAPDGYYLNDLKGNFVDGNIAATKLVGYKKKELIGKSFLKLKLLSAKEMPKAAAGLARNILGKSTGPDEYILNHKDGKQTAVEIRTFPVKIKGQTVVLGNVRDITERKRAKEKIEKSLKEKEVLLKEIHHRVKNNMQIISSLLNIQSANIEDENMREIFNVCQSRIRSMALMHETLYKSEDLARIDFSEYIRRLTTHLMSMYREGIEPIRFNLDIVDVYLDINRAIPCGMIINELVSNSLKHAFPDGKGGEIAVKMFTGKKKKVTLIVSDTGVGFPESLDFRETKSMGMQLVTDLTRQIKGTIKIGREKGTEYKIVF